MEKLESGLLQEPPSSSADFLKKKLQDLKLIVYPSNAHPPALLIGTPFPSVPPCYWLVQVYNHLLIAQVYPSVPNSRKCFSTSIQ